MSQLCWQHAKIISLKKKAAGPVGNPESYPLHNSKSEFRACPCRLESGFSIFMSSKSSTCIFMSTTFNT